MRNRLRLYFDSFLKFFRLDLILFGTRKLLAIPSDVARSYSKTQFSLSSEICSTARIFWLFSRCTIFNLQFQCLLKKQEIFFNHKRFFKLFPIPMGYGMKNPLEVFREIVCEKMHIIERNEKSNSNSSKLFNNLLCNNAKKMSSCY